MTTDPLSSGALFRLLSWLSPSFPIGAFSYSHGLEWLVEANLVHDEASLEAWVRDVLLIGGGRSEAILFLASYEAAQRGEIQELAGIAELSAAFCASAERHLETTAQGEAFAVAACTSWGAPSVDKLRAHYDGVIGYPVAVAITASDHGVPRDAALLAYLHAVAANMISAGLRLIPLGQTSGQRVTAAIEAAVSVAADTARHASLEDLGGGLLFGDMASMLHETQYTRLFRS